MTKLTKAIVGVPNGEIYPREIPAGEECPPELEAYAASIDAIEATSVDQPPAQDPAPDPDPEPIAEPEKAQKKAK